LQAHKERKKALQRVWNEGFKARIGFEIHAQLNAKYKLFSSKFPLYS
jgi:Glu-tRNA(Gln) amidotransferase subunit E-like FAD-binding protein